MTKHIEEAVAALCAQKPGFTPSRPTGARYAPRWRARLAGMFLLVGCAGLIGAGAFAVW